MMWWLFNRASCLRKVVRPSVLNNFLKKEVINPSLGWLLTELNYFSPFNLQMTQYCMERHKIVVENAFC